jgi:hypothetical protein
MVDARQQMGLPELDEKQSISGDGAQRAMRPTGTEKLNTAAIQQAITGAAKIGERALEEATTRHKQNADFSQAVGRPLLKLSNPIPTLSQRSVACVSIRSLTPRPLESIHHPLRCR